MNLLIVAGIIIVLCIVVFFVLVFRDDEKHIQHEEETLKQQFIQIVNEDNNRPLSGKLDKTYRGLAHLHFEDKRLRAFKSSFHQHIIGMDELINGILVSLLAGGHVLVEGVPGLAKTKTIHTFADLLGLGFKRIQFTPDMLPSDLTGIEIFNTHTKNFDIKFGPIFSHIVLADEINRTTPRVQSALLESMQEAHVSLGGKTHDLPYPFMVLATQNPIEQEGTYPLPEAQIDRFLCKLKVNYPTQEQEIQMLTTMEAEKKVTEKDVLFSIKELIHMKEEVQKVHVNADIKHSITDIVSRTRSKEYQQYIRYGSSPRGSLALMNTAKAVAYIQGRDYVVYDDVLMMLLPALRHRLILRYEAISQGIDEDEILTTLIQ